MSHISISEVVERHRALADPLRILIIRLLFERELCVCELVSILDEPQYKVSRHLAVLKNAGLVTEWRQGTWIHHDISPTLSPEWRLALQRLRDAWDQLPTIREMLTRIALCVTRQPGMACGDVCAAPQERARRQRTCSQNNITPQQHTGKTLQRRSRKHE